MTILKRDELYQEVWNTPIWKLAKKYGLSDRGLAKIREKWIFPDLPEDIA